VLDEKSISLAATSCLVEPIATELIFLIGRYDEILSTTYESLQPHHLVQYLFSLSNTISKALKELPVKNAAEDNVAIARLLLFYCSRKTLGEGLTILGITPLDQI